MFLRIGVKCGAVIDKKTRVFVRARSVKIQRLSYGVILANHSAVFYPDHPITDFHRVTEFKKTVVDPSHNPAPYTLNPHAFHPTTEPLNPKPSTQDGARPASDVSRLRTLTKSKYDRTNTRAPGWGFSRSFGSTRFTKCLKRTSSASVH